MDEALPLITASEANAQAWTEPILSIAIGRSHATTSVLDLCCGLPEMTSYEYRMKAVNHFALDFVINGCWYVSMTATLCIHASSKH